MNISTLSMGDNLSCILVVSVRVNKQEDLIMAATKCSIEET